MNNILNYLNHLPEIILENPGYLSPSPNKHFTDTFVVCNVINCKIEDAIAEYTIPTLLEGVNTHRYYPITLTEITGKNIGFRGQVAKVIGYEEITLRSAYSPSVWGDDNGVVYVSVDNLIKGLIHVRRLDAVKELCDNLATLYPVKATFSEEMNNVVNKLFKPF